MRVLHVATRHRSGGTERDLLALIGVERDAGHDVHVALGPDSDFDAFPPGVQLHRIDSLRRSVRPVADWRARQELAGVVAQGGFQVVHTHQSKAGVLGRLAARGAGPAIVHTVHMASFGPGYSGPASLAFRSLERHCGRFTDLVVCVGNELRTRYLGAGVADPSRYLIVRTPIDVGAYAAARAATPERRAAARAAFALPSEGPVVVAIGALEARKRHGLLLRALAPLLAGGRLTLAIAGTGLERGRLEALAARLGIANAVRFLGHVDPIELLTAANLMVLASRAEGVPRVLIESLAAGVPVVATDVEGLREVVDAPVDVVDRAGHALAGAVERRLAAGRPSAVPLEVLDEWSIDAVNRQFSGLLERVSNIVEARAPLPGGSRGMGFHL